MTYFTTIVVIRYELFITFNWRTKSKYHFNGVWCVKWIQHVRVLFIYVDFSYFFFSPTVKLTFQKQILTFRAWPNPETPEGNTINYPPRVHCYFSVLFYVYVLVYLIPIYFVQPFSEYDSDTYWKRIILNPTCDRI